MALIKTSAACAVQALRNKNVGGEVAKQVQCSIYDQNITMEVFKCGLDKNSLTLTISAQVAGLFFLMGLFF